MTEAADNAGIRSAPPLTQGRRVPRLRRSSLRRGSREPFRRWRGAGSGRSPGRSAAVLTCAAMELGSGGTPGKRVMRLALMSADGQPARRGAGLKTALLKNPALRKPSV